jgi:tetratricopeptide (TPR) repeat protein
MSRRLLILPALAIGTPLLAQDLPLKRALPAATIVACPAFNAPPTPVQAQIDEANRLATLGDEAALEGDHKSARDLFQQAAQINQVDASLGYRLAREDEAMQERGPAIREYCRYLFLSPNANDVNQIRDKLAALLPSSELSRGTTMVERFRAGVQSYDQSDWSGAAQAFSNVVDAAPGFGPGFYDLALSRAHAHHQTGAIRDFDEYLQLTPNASDREAVRQREIELRHELPSATTAFWIGLIPGGGQYYTRQIFLGVVVTGAAGGAIAWGAQSQTVTKTATFTDANGHPYSETYPATEHKYLAAGIGAAAGVTLLGAIQAAIVAHGRSTGLPPLGDTTATPATSGALPPRFRAPTIVASNGQLGLGLAFEFR